MAARAVTSDMPPVAAILAALRNPWLLLLIACVAGAGGTGWYRMRWLDAVHGQEAAVADAQRKADALANELVIAQAMAMAKTERTVTVWRDKVIHAPVTSSCGPVVGDALRGVREIVGSGQAGAPGGTPAAVPAAPPR